MAIKSVPQIADRKTRVFLSYSRRDIEFAQLLQTELEATGFHPMLDKTDIAPGEDWQDRLSKLIIEADAVVFSVSPNSAASKICGWEIAEAERLGKRIIPVVVDPVDTGLLPEALTRLNFIFFTDVSFAEGLAKLNSALNTDLDWVRQHTRIGEQAIEWQARKKSGARLLTGDALRQAEGWLINQPRDASPPTDLQKQFIVASRQNINRFQRWSLIGAIAVAAVAVALVFWGMINQIAKDEALQSAENTIQIALQTSRLLVEQTSSGDLRALPAAVRQKILTIALNVPNDLEKTGINNSSLKIVQANLNSEIAPLLLSLNHSDAAVKSAKQATNSLQNQLDTESATMEKEQVMLLRDYLSVAYNRLFNMQRQTKNYPDALVSAKMELKVALDAFDLARDSLHWEVSVATSYIDIGQAYEELDNTTDALKNFETAKAKLDLLAKNNPASDSIKGNRGVVYQFLGNLKYADEKYVEALPFYQVDFDVEEEFYNTDKTNPDTQFNFAVAHQNLGRSNMWLKQFDKAEEHLTAYYNLTKALSDFDPEDATALSNFASANNLLGTLYDEMGEPEKAIAYFKVDLAKSELIANADKDNDFAKVNLAKGYYNLARHGDDTRVNYTKANDILVELSTRGTLSAAEQNLQSLIIQSLANLPQ